MNCTHDDVEMNEGDAKFRSNHVYVPCDCIDCGEEAIREKKFVLNGEYSLGIEARAEYLEGN